MKNNAVVDPATTSNEKDEGDIGGNGLAQMRGVLTHPAVASLGDPLYGRP
jgi:hypothetical protein